MKKEYDLVGIGSPLLDRLASIDEDFLVRFDISKGHMGLVDSARLAQIQNGLTLKKEASGGACANVLAGAARLGSKTALIGKLGSDDAGKRFIADLETQHVRWAGAHSDEPTGICLTLITADAERSMQTALAASASLSPDDIDFDLVASAKILYLEAYLWDSPTARAAAEAAAAHGRSAGVLVALNLSDSLCVERHRARFKSFIGAHVDILIANEEEICSFHEISDFGVAAEKVSAMDLTYTAITRGSDGAVVFNGGESIAIKALPVAQLLDTTGAGDMFAAGFLHQLAASGDAQAGGLKGVECAAAIIQVYGARLL